MNASRRRRLLSSGSHGLSGLPGLLAEYRFDEGGGSTVVDHSGNSNNATVGSGGSFGPYGLSTGYTTGYVNTPIAWTSVKTLVLFCIPPPGLNTSGNVGSTWADSQSLTTNTCRLGFNGTASMGQLYPRGYNETASTVGFETNFSTPSWPVVVGMTDPTGSPALWLEGVPSGIYDIYGAVPVAGQLRLGADNQGTTDNYVLCYALVFSSILTQPQMAQVAAYCRSQTGSRNIPVSGPVTLSKMLVTFSGNSLTNNMVTSNIVLHQNADLLKIAIVGATPDHVTTLALQATFPLYRPLAVANVAVIWPTPNATTVPDILANATALGQTLMAKGFRVVLISALSATGFDAIKDGINAQYADPAVGWTSFANAYCDLTSQAAISADGAYLGSAYIDQVHITQAAYASYVYPTLIATIAGLLPPGAYYTTSPSPPAALAGTTATFTDGSLGAVTSRSWDFGDGTTSTATNPTHSWSVNGTYQVALTATGPLGSTTYSNYFVVGAEAGIFALSPYAWITADPLYTLTTAGTTPVAGNNVQTCVDRTGNGLSATQLVIALQPTLQQISGQYVLRFHQQLGEYLSWAASAFSAYTGGAEIFVVQRQIVDSGDSTTNGIWTFGSSGSGDYYPFGGSSLYNGFASSIRHGPYSPAPATLTNFNVFHVASAPSSFIMDMNATNLVTSTTNAVAWTTTPRYGVSQGSNGGLELSDLIITPPLSSTNRATVMAYLKAKYGTP